MSEPDITMSVAIIGMAGRFPGADTVNTFWQNLCEKKDVREQFTDEQLKASNLSDEASRFSDFVTKGYRLNDVDQFAASFFDITPRQAKMIDPQQRLFLETTWQALEDAGYVPDEYPGHVGVYAGANFNNYIFNVADHFDLRDIDVYLEAMIANDKDYLTSRVSHKLNLTGPAITVLTSCSSSLAAIATAYQSLLDYQCDMAIAGGVGLNIPQERGYRFYKEGGLSKDAACHAFDADGTGVIHGNGVGVIIMKRLEDAIEDGDNISAVIKAAAINNDGAKKVAYAAPSVDGQSDVIRETLAMADIRPESIRFIEAHGTGTPVGDPIEFTAIKRAYGLTSPHSTHSGNNPRCALGSVKTNIGHLGAASGVAGVIKAALALKHRQLPPLMHFSSPNPELGLENTPFYVNTALEDWSSETWDQPVNAAVSSFGIGGTNVHLILQEMHSADKKPVDDAPHSSTIFPLSAKSKEALQAQADQLLDYLTKNPDTQFNDIAFTLQRGRKAFPHRRFIVSQHRDDLIKKLGAKPTRGQVAEINAQNAISKTAFMFPGVGDQYVGMGADLYREQIPFRDAIDTCANILLPLLELDIRDVLYPSDTGRALAESQLNQPEIGMACLVSLQHALVEQLAAWGIAPDKLIGHSLGEYCAALTAGVFSLEQALSLVVFRGRLIRQCMPGGMLVVSQDSSELQGSLPGSLSLAVVNAPNLCMVSGPLAEINAFEQELKADKTGFHRLPGERAGHSSTLDPILSEFHEFVQSMNLQAPSIPFVSNVTGTFITPEQAVSPDYWVRHLRETVLFHQGLSVIMQDEQAVLFELGAGRGLTTMAKRHPEFGRKRKIIPTMRSADKALNDNDVLNEALGTLWLTGLPIDWGKVRATAVNEGAVGKRTALPTYPFERESYWLERKRHNGHGQHSETPSGSVTLEKRADMASWFYAPSWQQRPKRVEVPSTKARCYLVFNRDQSVLNELKEQHETRGDNVITVDWAETYCRQSSNQFCIRAGEPADYQRLLSEVVEAGSIPDVIVHGWQLSELDRHLPKSTEQLSGSLSQQTGYLSLMYLLSAMSDKQLTGAETRLVVLSRELYKVTGEEEVSPNQATLLGPCKVIPYEFPELNFLHIDIDAKVASASNPIGLIKEIDQSEPQRESRFLSVAYRNGLRWEPVYTPLTPSLPNAGDLAKKSLRQEGTYLVTGASGGIGATAASWLASEVESPNLILVSRTELPSRDIWSQWMKTYEDEPDPSKEMQQIYQRIGQVKTLEQQGAKVHVFAVDVADRDGMVSLKTTIEAKFGAVNGIVHAAGVVGGGLMTLEATAESHLNLNSKVVGTVLLHQLFEGQQLDFMLLCSSMGAIAGSLGQVENTAANIFLDTFAQHHANPCTRQENATRILSVNWDYWLEVGMILDLAERHEKITGSSMDIGILPQEGMTCFNHVLAQSLPQLIVSTADLPLLIKQRSQSVDQAISLFEQADISNEQHHFDRSNLSSDYLAPRNAVEQVLAMLWQQRLGIDAVGVNDDFLELGGDSMLALPLMADMRDALQFDLPIRALFSEQNIARIAALITDNESEPGLSEHIADIYLKVRSLSPDEVKKVLAEEEQASTV
ncbi:type I polyketide synthase [Veronia pacifica]|uniref:Uncharacterized protein n=1 Tax=Veronia pacifica TaxID=1080227 RepID=A0A1C3EMD0_9GAMM|nr:type I polyketide synthase [Veronia pacifica]ODA34382.1 hypothetical protein A8L45_06565 [Veronia pacifica]